MTTTRSKLLAGQLQRVGARPEDVKLSIPDPEQLIQTITDADATPSVLTTDGNTLFKTANTGATTITDLDDGRVGQRVDVIIGDANTTIDFTGTNLTRTAGTDWSPGSGDKMTCVYDGTTWYCDTW